MNTPKDTEPKKHNSKLGKTVAAAAISLLTTAAGFFVIPKAMQKFGAKLYRASLQKKKTDLDSLGPDTKEKE